MKRNKNWTLYMILMIFSIGCGPTEQSKDNKTVKANSPSTSITSIPKVDFSAIEKILRTNDDTLRVVNFWATWCKPCVEELPILEKLPAAFSDQPFLLYYISLDFSNQIDEKLIPFLKENPLNGEVIVLDDADSNSWIDKVDPSWSGAIPATVITKGGVQKFHEGKLNSFKDIQHLITQLSPFNS